MIWTVAHTTLNDAEKQEQNIIVTTSNMSGNISSNLTIPALPTNNKIEIGCIVITDNPFDAVAKEAVLTVKGYIECISQFILTHSYRCILSSKCSMAFWSKFTNLVTSFFLF